MLRMPGIRTNAAAEVLGVSPNTLRSWERRYGYPVPKRTPGNHRNYELVELQTLRDALAQTGNISSAIELARQRQAAPASGDGLLRRLGELRRGRRRPRDRGEPGAAAAGAHGRGAAAAGDRRARRRPRPRGGAGVRLALGDGLAARRPPSRLLRLAPGRDPAARLQPRLRTPRRSTRRRSTSPCAAPASAS